MSLRLNGSTFFTQAAVSTRLGSQAAASSSLPPPTSLNPELFERLKTVLKTGCTENDGLDGASRQGHYTKDISVIFKGSRTTQQTVKSYDNSSVSIRYWQASLFGQFGGKAYYVVGYEHNGRPDNGKQHEDNWYLEASTGKLLGYHTHTNSYSSGMLLDNGLLNNPPKLGDAQAVSQSLQQLKTILTDFLPLPRPNMF